MTKYYFISFIGDTLDGISISGCRLYRVENASLAQLMEVIKEVNKLKSAVITSMKDLTEEEYNMLKDNTPE